MFTQAVKKEEYDNTLQNVLSEIKSILESKTIIYSSENKAIVTERLLTALRHIQTGNPLEKIIKGQILEACLKTEKSGPNSTDMFLSFLIQSIETIGKSEWKINEIKDEIDRQYREYKSTLSQTYNKPTLDDIRECVTASSKDIRISEMVLEAINLAGLEGNILPLWRPGDYCLELVSGYNFPVTTYPLFTDADQGRWERKDVKCLIIDGVIEKESEIHTIFMDVAQSKYPLLIVSRGYGEEVIATIAANKTLDICPIRIPWELESINFISDISITCDSQIVSPLKGDMVSFVKFDDLPIVEHVVCTRSNLNIINQPTNNSVSNHITDLVNRREEAVGEKLQEILTSRIKSLNSHTVHMYLGSKNEQEKMKELEAADFGLRIVKSVLDKGTVIPGKTLKEFCNFNEKRPTLSVLSAVHHGINLAKSLSFTEIAIISS